MIIRPLSASAWGMAERPRIWSTSPVSIALRGMPANSASSGLWTITRPPAVLNAGKAALRDLLGRLDGLALDPALQSPKGEIVILVGPGAEEAVSADQAEAALADALRRLGPADAASEVAKALGLNRRELYRRAIAMKVAE